jgi:hypothetical protein
MNPAVVIPTGLVPTLLSRFAAAGVEGRVLAWVHANVCIEKKAVGSLEAAWQVRAAAALWCSQLLTARHSTIAAGPHNSFHIAARN